MFRLSSDDYASACTSFTNANMFQCAEDRLSPVIKYAVKNIVDDDYDDPDLITALVKNKKILNVAEWWDTLVKKGDMSAWRAITWNKLEGLIMHEKCVFDTNQLTQQADER